MRLAKQVKAKPSAKLSEHDVELLDNFTERIKELDGEIKKLEEREKELSRLVDVSKQGAKWHLGVEKSRLRNGWLFSAKTIAIGAILRHTTIIRIQTRSPSSCSMKSNGLTRLQDMLLHIFNDGELQLRNGKRPIFVILSSF